MKKGISFLMAVSILLSLCGCGGSAKNEKVQHIESLIAELDETEMSLSMGEKIKSIQREYSYLSEEDRVLVKNYDSLLRAVDSYSDYLCATVEGTWISGRGKNRDGSEYDVTYIFAEGGAGSYMDYNYATGEKMNSGTLRWTLDDLILTCELSSIIVGLITFSYRLSEEDGNLCMTEIGTERELVFRKQ